jgi:ubiquinone/menaquinone biosynthesis C-methylase UbiE
MATVAQAGQPARYGFDAPRVMVTLLGMGGALVGAGLVGALLFSGWLFWAAVFIIADGLIPLVLGLAMLAYGLAGKMRMRDRMLAMIDWRGDEQVLDVGTGRGLLLIGAAKRLRSPGRATGIDIWRSEDLSDNTLDALAANVAAEGVEDRVALLTQDARTLQFRDGSFDVVFSLYCIHNIDGEAEQDRALLEIARVLKPGGRALIGEWLPTSRYASVLRNAGLTIRSNHTYFATALGPMWMVDAEKPVTAARI